MGSREVVTIYHNPRCSKSREALRLLREQGCEPRIVRYLETPPRPVQLRILLTQLGCSPPRELLRKREAPYLEQGLDNASLRDEVLLRAMSDHPILVERPIVTCGARAVLGRPPERVLTLLQPGAAFPETPAEPGAARRLQEVGRGVVELRDRLPKPHRIAGVDVALPRGGRIARAAVVVLSFPELQLLEQVTAERPVSFPYIPGLLSFRELPAIVAALERLRQAPDLMLCDGQGYAHPRRFGLACHLGVITGLPTVGVAKSRLCGVHAGLGDGKGSHAALHDRGELVGYVLRTRAATAPLYVSPGHRVSPLTALHYTLACTTRYRLPETTRRAHHLASGAP